MGWLNIRKPLSGPTVEQRMCGREAVSHIWSGTPLTERMHCDYCGYYPYKAQPKLPQQETQSLSLSGYGISGPGVVSLPASVKWVASSEEIALPPAVDPNKLTSLRSAKPYKVAERSPDYIEVITAWRAWVAVNTDAGWRLKALGKNYVWEPKKQVDATCSKSSNGFSFRVGATGITPIIKAAPEHPAPQMDCTCGVWAFRELDSLVEAIGNNYGEIRVLGQVSLWGRVVETTNGYRAQHAYPSELWLFDNSLEELGAIYDVPVRTLSQ